MNLFMFALLSLSFLCSWNMQADTTFVTLLKKPLCCSINNIERSEPKSSSDTIVKENSEYESMGDANHLVLTSKDIDVFFGGRVREEYFTGQRTITLSKSFPDSYNFFRHRAELLFGTRYGLKTYGTPAIESGMKLISFFNWRFEDLYAPLENYYTVLQKQNKKNLFVSVPIAHRHTRRAPLIYPEELWLKTDFAVFIDRLKDKEHSLTLGYFPYQVGRGLALGPAYEGGIGYMGFARPAVGAYSGSTPPHAPFLAPGILFHGTITKEVAYEFYFSKWRVAATQPWSTEVLQAKFLDPEVPGLFGNVQDADEWTAKLQFNMQPFNEAKLYAEPYYVYLHSPQHTVQALYGQTILGDSSVTCNTGGVMVDFAWKGFTFNAEVAGQWGTQKMHAIERDALTFNTSTFDGGVLKSQALSILELAVPNPTDQTTFPASPDVYSLGASPGQTFFDLYNSVAYPTISDDVITELKRTTLQRSPAQNGTLIKNPNSANPSANAAMNPYFWPSADGTSYRLLYNKGDWYVGFGKSRYRPAYTIKLAGWMGLCDIGYEFEKAPVKLYAAAGIISGDAYPYNEEVDKTYKGFLPLRDINYQGYMVKSIAIFTYRLMPRPLNIDTSDILARSHIDDVSNLRLLGFGINYAPLKDKKQLVLNANIVWFWDDALVFKWDKNGSISVPQQPTGNASKEAWNAYAVAKAHEDSRRAYVGNSPTGVNFQGWQSLEPASKELGTELNCQAMYRLTKNSDVVFRGGVFIPGQLYKDLEGQPNILTRTWVHTDAEVRRSLGSDWCYAWNLRFQYIF